MSDPDLSDPDIPKLMLRLGLPAMAGLTLNAAHQMVDAGFVGQLGTVPLATLVLLSPFAGLVAALGVGLGVGAASTVARALGENNFDRVRSIVGLSFTVAAILAVTLWVCLQQLRDPIFNVLNIPQETAVLAKAYFPIQTLTIGFGLIQILCDFIAIGRGESRMSLKTLALCFGLNMALDPIYIFSFGLGLNGAAWATLTAQIVTLSVWAVWFSTPRRRPQLGSFRLLWPILRVGLPEAAALAVTTIGLLAVLRLATTLGGVDSVAGLGLALRVLLLVSLPLEGFAIGVQPILAHAHGAGDPERITRAQSLLIRGALITGCLCAVGLASFGGSISALLSDTVTMHNETISALNWLLLTLPAIALRLVAQISLSAAIQPARAMLLGLAPMGWLLWPALAILVPQFGVAGLTMAITCSAYLAAALAWALLRHCRFSTETMKVSA